MWVGSGLQLQRPMWHGRIGRWGAGQFFSGAESTSQRSTGRVGPTRWGDIETTRIIARLYGCVRTVGWSPLYLNRQNQRMFPGVVPWPGCARFLAKDTGPSLGGVDGSLGRLGVGGCSYRMGDMLGVGAAYEFGRPECTDGEESRQPLVAHRVIPGKGGQCSGCGTCLKLRSRKDGWRV